MRKKSHISVAKGIIHELGDSDSINHRFSFYIGSIWPDCVPSFLTRRHCMDETYELFVKKMEKFVRKYDVKKEMNIRSTWRMGIVMHYIADYFTFPHNKHFEGNFKQHCMYEKELKHRMYEYIDSIKCGETLCERTLLKDISDIKDYIRSYHESYVEQSGNVDIDCEYTLAVCLGVFASLLSIASGKVCIE